MADGLVASYGSSVECPRFGPSNGDARRWLKRIIWGGLLGGLAGCSVLVDTSGLSGGGSDGGSLLPGVDGGALSTGSSESGGSSPGSPGDDDAGGSQSDDGGGVIGTDSGLPDAASTCGPVDTASNCGSCGVACDTDSGTPSCTSGSCAYVCSAGRADCNQTASNTDGCECATPGCCATGCQTTHNDGVGQSYYDCNPTKTVTELEALEACTAYAGGDAGACSGGWNCSGANTQYVCFSNDNGTDCTSFCWGYSGSRAGKVDDCSCPSNPVGTWN
ncbi:MAG TPA: hypothetical protein VGI39_10705 [Polyangiaceae bacterium]|jgi:hypothetical protein